MKAAGAVLIVVAATMFASAAARGSEKASVPLGPNAYSKAVTKGQLRVYSATERIMEGGVTFKRHTHYKILSPGGQLVRRVTNHTSISDESPALVTLPPGEYTVVAKTHGCGLCEVPVLIKPGQVTLVYLDDSHNLSETEEGGKEIVRTAGGKVAGWRVQEKATK